MVVQLDLPDALLFSTGQTEEEFVREAKLLLALKLFEMGRLSSGQAAELAGMTRVELMFRAGEMKVPVVDLDPSDLEREFLDA